jgi:hypothetical protein
MKPSSTFRLTVAALALMATAASAGAQSFSYAPGTAKYRTTGSSKMVQEVMGQKMDADVSMTRIVSVQVAPHRGDTVAMTVRLDSLESRMGEMPTPGLDAVLGTAVATLMSPGGRHYAHTVKGDTTNPAVAGLAEELSRFLPRIRGNLRAGATWTDTIADKGNQGGIEVDRKGIVVSRVVGEEDFGGTRAWKIARTAEVEISGAGTSQGQPMSIEGTIRTEGAVYMTSDAYVGTEQSDEVKMKVTLIASGMEMQLTQSGTQKTERVR